MRHSSERILTSHVGSLPRPSELMERFKSGAADDEVQKSLRAAVADVVKKQLDVGIDIVNDGEFGKPMSDEVDFGAWESYVYSRVTGFEMRDPDFADFTALDFAEFADFYASENEATDPDAQFKVGANVGEVTYVGGELVRRDIENLKAALPAGKAGDAFLSSMGTGVEEYTQKPEYYASSEEQAAAVAEAMREEYRAIADAGLTVQIDDPWLVETWQAAYAKDGDVEGFRKWAHGHIELINHSLDGIPQDQVRFHICWGSWTGPHKSDLPLKDAVDLLLSINAGLYSVEAANPMHEHEWRVWQDVKLPEGKILMPGVVTHKTNVLEHPEVVADRIVRYAESVGRENVIAGTDCGMGGRIHPSIAWAKLKNLSDGAELASKQLWS